MPRIPEMLMMSGAWVDIGIHLHGFDNYGIALTDVEEPGGVAAIDRDLQQILVREIMRIGLDGGSAPAFLWFAFGRLFGRFNRGLFRRFFGRFFGRLFRRFFGWLFRRFFGWFNRGFDRGFDQ